MVGIICAFIAISAAVAEAVIWTNEKKILRKTIERRDRRIFDLINETEFFSQKCKDKDIVIGKLQREVERLTRLVKEEEASGDNGK